MLAGLLQLLQDLQLLHLRLAMVLLEPSPLGLEGKDVFLEVLHPARPLVVARLEVIVLGLETAGIPHALNRRKSTVLLLILRKASS
jgi:hypothetical protein